MMPKKLVVPLVATTAKNISVVLEQHLAEPVTQSRRHFSSTSTPAISASMTWHAESIEECAAAFVAATRHGRAPAPARPSWAARAQAFARRDQRERLPIVPPGTNTPPELAGSPAVDQHGARFSA